MRGSALLAGILGGIVNILVDIDHVPSRLLGIPTAVPLNVFDFEEGRFLHPLFFFIGVAGLACSGGLLLLLFLRDTFLYYQNDITFRRLKDEGFIMEPMQNEKLFIASVDHYLSLIKEQKVRDCYSGLQYLAQKLADRKLAVRANVAEQIRERYKVSKRAFYGANRSVEVTSQTTLDVEGQ